mmetsp:Transcript_29599/g.55815  ORF Transcript_29599/g.55815 Transcript_29599/m.55815 type:complete len:86 (-) Transcript_29599:614-871(-)
MLFISDLGGEPFRGRFEGGKEGDGGGEDAGEDIFKLFVAVVVVVDVVVVDAVVWSFDSKPVNLILSSSCLLLSLSIVSSTLLSTS